MTISSQAAVWHLEEVINGAERIACHDGRPDDLTSHEVIEAHVSLIHALKRCCPPGTVYDQRVQQIVGDGHAEHGQMIFQIGLLYGVAKGLMREWTLDRLQTFRELIHAELFSDMLDAASYLLGEGHKDAAAVTVGGVLEQHVRKLCVKHAVSTSVSDQYGDQRPKKLSALIAELASQSVFDRNTHKQLTWLSGLRNSAAHAEYGAYDDKKVELMIQGVRQFVTECPA